MRKVINGRKYDTDTAKLIGSWSNGYNTGDFNYYEKTLYRKRNGEFFTDSEGFLEWIGNSCGYSHVITPLTDDEAKMWAEEHLSYETYVEVFGEPEE